ncbi:hypothetical protein SAY87_027281 [Trapa incisa]|uniref:Peptidase A1 domain-containing protein n=1 Tax=Trapa incisa TaxID=236973 RepID=A0AAN7H4I6_9MYRT|nr:hypothetical protein SAY87_027281 [Trapa incisa]
MDVKVSLSIVLILYSDLIFGRGGGAAAASVHMRDIQNGCSLGAIELSDHMGFNAVSSAAATGCGFSSTKPPESMDSDDRSSNNLEDDGNERGVSSSPWTRSQRDTVKLHLKRRPTSSKAAGGGGLRESVSKFTNRDISRIHTLYRRMTERKNVNTISGVTAVQEREENPHRRSETQQVNPPAPPPLPEIYRNDVLSGQLMATVVSGLTLGSHEYFMDVFIGTPPKHFLLILDTGSDINWIQCVPCYDCFEQNGPHYDPKNSSSFKNITCRDRRCGMVTSPHPPQPCKDDGQTCPYFYSYSDNSNTTGDFSVETFTLNLTANDGKPRYRRVENVMFGCGHWNRGLFQGAAGVMGLGRGPLSFSSQLQSLYGHSFSYCLVDRNSNASVSSKLIFGEDKELLSHPNLNFTSFLAGKKNPDDSFYYVQIKWIFVDGEALDIPKETWERSEDGSGGTIIDSGTTLTYFAEPASTIIKEAFARKVGNKYPLVDNEYFYPCYNVSGVDKMELPEFGMEFADGAVWNFPVENYFIDIQEEHAFCLVLMGTAKSSFSIIGNYQQQNFHILYDTKRWRLGYAPMKCAEV